MIRATLNDQVVAESDDVVEVDGCVYFRRRDIRPGVLRTCPFTTHCGLKGDAHYFDVVVPGRRMRRGAFHYPDPLPAPVDVTGRIAFWKAVVIEID
jgi:uncharacterized protein (DUF427 family)